MDGDQHVLGLGKIVGNLHSLEVAIRVFLCEAHGETIQLPAAPSGTVAETHVTSFASLGGLIKEYNDCLSPAEQAHRVDPQAVTIRDAIAHGRLTSGAKEFPLTLVKFASRNSTGMIPVEFVQVISEQWLEDARKLAKQQIDNVQNCAKARKYKNLC
jgi:hypothetical protein